MGDHTHGCGSRSTHGSEPDQRAEPVRSRWTPKPEQILILESIFNSGMVNPPKDETVRIRKLLEKFGSVGDANVFYWFQNRRSRSRRRQRQIQASLNGGGDQAQAGGGDGGGVMQYENGMGGSGFGSGSLTYHPHMSMDTSSCIVGSSSSSYGLVGGNHEGNINGDQDLYSYSSGLSGIQEYEQNPMICPSDNASGYQNYQFGVITVFINGVATEVGRGPLDMRAMFGGDFVLFHSSGVPIQVNEYGFLMQSLEHGESYFLVPRHS